MRSTGTLGYAPVHFASRREVMRMETPQREALEIVRSATENMRDVLKKVAKSVINERQGLLEVGEQIKKQLEAFAKLKGE